MKTVNISVNDKFKELTTADLDSLFSGFVCYDGMIDTRYSWYGGLITAEMPEESLVFVHDMPNGEWDSWYKTTLRIMKEKKLLAEENESMS